MDSDDMAARRAIAAQVADYLGNPGPKDHRYRALLARAITAGRFIPPTPTAAPGDLARAVTAKRRKPRDPRAARTPRYTTPDGVKRPKPGTPMRVRGIVGMVK